jgi:GH24 family phage-related lysozyme (muramidase)
MICFVFGNFTICTGKTSKSVICILFEYKAKCSGKAAIICELRLAAEIGGSVEM